LWVWLLVSAGESARVVVVILVVFGSFGSPHHARNIPEPPRPLHAHFVSTQHATLLKMPPKGKKGQEKGKSTEEERDEPLQAVVRSAMRLCCRQG
jgi:hypothetical protein